MRIRWLSFVLLVSLNAFRAAAAVAPSLSFDGQAINLSAENGSFGQILEIFKQQTGLEYDVPPDLKAERLPLVDIRGLSMRAALMKIFEGCNYDYILMAEPANPEKIAKVLVTGKSSKVTATAVAAAGSPGSPRRAARQVVEDPFGGGGEEQFDDASVNEGENANQVPAENPAAPAVPGPLGVQPQPGAPLPGQPNPNPGQMTPSQPYPPGMMPQQPGQPLIQPQVLQPAPGNTNNPNNPNDRRSPF